MRGSEIRFYGDRDDLVNQFERLSRLGDFKYTKTLSALNSKNIQFKDPKGLPAFVITSHPQPANVFLVCGEGSEISVKEIRMEDGSGLKYAADQAINPDCVLLRLGGTIDPDTLIATSVNTTGETPRAKDVFRLFKKAIADEATLIDGFYVLPGALKKLQAGWRLTTGVSHSRALDLKK